MYFIIGFCAAAAMISLAVRSLAPAIGRQTAVAAAAVAAVSLIGAMSGVFDELCEIAALGGIGAETIKYSMKAIGIAYITRIAASICSDAGESTLEETAEIAGRIALVLMTLPIIRRIAEYLLDLLKSVV
jgi:stage III sporulation protein AD